MSSDDDSEEKKPEPLYYVSGLVGAVHEIRNTAKFTMDSSHLTSAESHLLLLIAEVERREKEVVVSAVEDFNQKHPVGTVGVICEGGSPVYAVTLEPAVARKATLRHGCNYDETSTYVWEGAVLVQYKHYNVVAEKMLDTGQFLRVSLDEAGEAALRLSTLRHHAEQAWLRRSPEK